MGRKPSAFMVPVDIRNLTKTKDGKLGCKRCKKPYSILYANSEGIPVCKSCLGEN